jgi:hypothetical protein
MHCRTKSGTQRLVHQGEEIILDVVGCDLPDDLANSLIGHVNLEFGEVPASEPEPEPPKKASKKAATD